MVRACLGLRVLLQLWLLPLSAATSRGMTDTGTDVGVTDEASDMAVLREADESRKTEGLDEPQRRIRGRVGSPVANNATLDRYHRDERETHTHRMFTHQTRIIGGRASTDNQHSYVVSLQDGSGRHFCGGTLVSKDVVLTAAHCASPVTKIWEVWAVVGRRQLSDGDDGEEIRVTAQKIHPRYDVARAHVEWGSDFALLFLARPTMTRARVVELNRRADLPPWRGLVGVAGWGDTDPSEVVRRPADALQVANLRTLSNARCDNTTGTHGEFALSYRGHIRDDMLCASSRRSDSCQGDSGGPLTFRGKQVGITSWGVGCNSPSFPGVYARVSSAYGWIRRHVCSRSMYPNPQLDCEPW